MRISVILANFVLVTCHSLGERDHNDYDADKVEIVNGVPHYPVPSYSAAGEIEFFPRIIGGQRAVKGEFPAKVSVQTRSGFHICGGALLDMNHVLTAAHCISEDGRVFNPTRIQIMGNDLQIGRGGSTTRQVRFVSHIFAHPLYNSNTLAYDIAVVRVENPFQVTNNFRAMPRSFMRPFSGTICKLAGWGATNEDNPVSTVHLMRVDLEVIDIQICNGSRSYQGLIPENHFCVGHMAGGRDACFGDSGGGLICNNQIAGVVSFGYGCGRPRFPGVYVDVSQYNRWIGESIESDIPHEDIPTPAPGSSNVIQLFNVIFLAFIITVNFIYI